MCNYLKFGERPTVIVGAGFTLATLSDPPPSTSNIIMKTANDFNKRCFPILKYLSIRFPEKSLSLNNVWSNIDYFSSMINDVRYDIYKQYKANENSLIYNYFSLRVNPENFIPTMLGLELKRMIALQMTSEIMSGKRNKLFERISSLIKGKEFEKVSWISLNYDTCLESLLQDEGMDWIYPFEHEYSKHVIIKPHGSLNMSFETNWFTSPIEHKLNYCDTKNKFSTFNEHDVGITKQAREYRPWLVGYLPDYLKDEHNTRVDNSDISHDLCRLNIGTFSMELQKATSLTILGYSMPFEDEWIWKKINMLLNRKIPIFIFSKNSSERIKEQFSKYGFTNLVIENSGKING